MNSFLFYLLQVFASSGILYLYYVLALKNRLFHRWNRFYLLASVVFSLVCPLIQFEISTERIPADHTIQLLQVVQSTNTYLEEITTSSQNNTSIEIWFLFSYIFIALLLLASFMYSLMRIFSIAKTNSVRRIEKIRLIETEVNGSPFSFLDMIFWNKAIDISSPDGQRIFRHELVHVKEKHSIDIIFMQVVLIFFWCLPVFWLIRKELKLIHEFIADKEAVSDNGPEVLSRMILQASYPCQFNSIVNPFFQTSIKRRILMISKNQKSRINYLGRMAVVPLTALLIFGFTIKNRQLPASLDLKKNYTVVIDAGHGIQDGNPSGAGVKEISEDEIVMKIAEKIKSNNGNKNINIILSRTSSQSVPLARRVEIAKENKADLFLSIHLSATEQDQDKSGMRIYVPSKNETFQFQSKLFASAIQKEISPSYTIDPELNQSPSTIYVLDKNICPAALLECGYITNTRDREFISKSKNQETLARNILVAIEKYAASMEDKKTGN